jgi:hypothetical protein
VLGTYINNALTNGNVGVARAYLDQYGQYANPVQLEQFNNALGKAERAQSDIKYTDGIYAAYGHNLTGAAAQITKDYNADGANPLMADAMQKQYQSLYYGKLRDQQLQHEQDVLDLGPKVMGDHSGTAISRIRGSNLPAETKQRMISAKVSNDYLAATGTPEQQFWAGYAQKGFYADQKTLAEYSAMQQAGGDVTSIQTKADNAHNRVAAYWNQAYGGPQPHEVAPEANPNLADFTHAQDTNEGTPEEKFSKTIDVINSWKDNGMSNNEIRSTLLAHNLGAYLDYVPAEEEEKPAYDINQLGD